MATMQMKVRPEDLSQVPHGRRANSRPGHPGDLWRVGRPDQAQAAAGAVPPASRTACCRRSSRIVGVARRPLGDEFAADMREGIIEFGGVDASDPKLDDFVKKISYFRAELRRSLRTTRG